jgi:DNA gyrase subunit A
MLVVPDFEQANFITLMTRQGRIKRVEANAFANIRSVGLIAMTLDEGDSLDFAKLTDGGQEFLVVTRNGKALRFAEEHCAPDGPHGGGRDGDSPDRRRPYCGVGSRAGGT